jgi:EmrB/QacA subfamily drug resistance transporter
MATRERSGSSVSEPANERGIIATVALATMLAPLNSTMIAVALPSVIQEFETDVAGAGWLVTAYLITMASLQPVAGKLGDRFGRRPLILGGVACFGLASVAAAWASSLTTLLVFRVLQAVSGAIALPNGAALLREVVPPERRAGRFGLVGAAIAFAAAAGPPLGGFLVSQAGWRSIFEVNVFLVLPAVLIGWRSIPVRPVRASHASFDVAGSVLFLAVVLGAAALLTGGSWNAGTLVATTALGVTGTLFLRRELRHSDPVLQPRFFRLRAFAAANAAVALSNLAMYTTLLAIPILLSRTPGWNSAEVGLVLAAMSIGMVVLAPMGGRLADAWGRRWPTVIGLSGLALGLLPLAASGGTIATLVLLGSLAVAGVGLGLSSAGLQVAAVESVALEESGVAAGVFSTSRYLGSIVGASLLAGMLGPVEDGVSGFGAVFIMAVAAAFLSALASVGLHDRPAA